MSTLTAQDVMPYTLAFKAKYGRDTTLSIDDMEAVIMNAEADMTAEDFAEAFKEAEVDTNDRSQNNDDNGVVMAGDIDDYRKRFPKQTAKYSDKQLSDLVMATEDDMDDADWIKYFETGSIPSDEPSTVIESTDAYEYSKRLDADKQFNDDLETNAKAALENKRGAAVIRRDIVRLFGEETIATVWPIPGSSNKTHPGSNRKLHRYPTIVRDSEGQSKAGEGDWYYDLLDGTTEGKRLVAAIESIKAAKKGETGKHILPEHAALAGDEIKLTAVKAQLEGKRSTKKAAIIRAVNIVQTMHRLNNETEMAVELITDDGTPEGMPVESQKLLYVYNSKDRKQFRVLTIGQLLALDVDKAKGDGGTYNAVVGTTGRQPKGAGKEAKTVPQIDNVALYDECTAVYATFFDKLIGDAKATNALLTHLNSAGTDDLLLSMNKIALGLDGFLSKPGIAKRLSDLLAEDKKSKAA